MQRDYFNGIVAGIDFSENRLHIIGINGGKSSFMQVDKAERHQIGQRVKVIHSPSGEAKLME